MSSNEISNLPRWDLSGVYPSLESDELTADRQKLNSLLSNLESFVKENEIARDGLIPAAASQAAKVIDGFLELQNEVGDLYESLEAYLHSFITTDSYNSEAARLMSLLEPDKVRLENVETLFHGWLGQIAEKDLLLDEVLQKSGTAKAHTLYLTESARQSQYLMSDAEESLASELSLSGANAWSKLQGVIVSQLKAEMEIAGEIKELPLSQLSTYAADPEEQVRANAYWASEKALESAREPLAACLNGVKGFVNILDRRRGRQDALHDSLDKSRIDRSVLETMFEAMRLASPMMRRYRKAKAILLGKERMEQWDLPAPVGNATRLYQWKEAKEFILSNFATYSDKMEQLAKRAFDEAWIDAEPRDGKQVGAFCMRIPSVEESRILMSYDGRLNQLTTLAHELGHAYHNRCLEGRTNLQAALPMTLAETASIFCENIVTDAILNKADDAQAELAVLDSFLVNASYLTLEVYSRYLFEKEVFVRRQEAELSADEFCELSDEFNRLTLGDTIAAGTYRPYEWARLPHYYLVDLSFYNYPYAFGFLFSLGLYQLHKQGEPGFHEKYDKLLADSGTESAVDLGRRVGIDINDIQFWNGSYKVVEQRIDRYEELVDEQLAMD